MIQFFRSIFDIYDEKKKIEEYLSESVSLVDLEMRERMITRGEAPFQRSRNAYKRGLHYAN